MPKPLTSVTADIAIGTRIQQLLAEIETMPIVSLHGDHYVPKAQVLALLSTLLERQAQHVQPPVEQPAVGADRG